VQKNEGKKQQLDRHTLTHTDRRTYTLVKTPSVRDLNKADEVDLRGRDEEAGRAEQVFLTLPTKKIKAIVLCIPHEM